LLHLPPVEPDPAFHAVVKGFMPFGDDNRALVEIFGCEGARIIPAGP
jgi:hypothetical protein